MPGEQSHFRPDIVVRVFHLKLKCLNQSIIKNKIFGTVDALIYTLEFQKRGLPHAHILLTLDSNDKIITVDEIDKAVSAEIPKANDNPKLHDLVAKHMMHGPCGSLNPNSVCMQNGQCKKKIPKDFCETTQENVNGYPRYKRPNNGIYVTVRGQQLDNRYVVPYNSYLLAKYNCHINVEVCTTVKSVKYIYKYVYKGYDSAVVKFVRTENDVVVEYDEIDAFLSGRYVGSTQSVWRIFEFEMHFQTHTIIRLDIHLPNRQTVYFREGNEMEAVENPKNTKLLAFFELNREDPFANSLLYTEVPYNYVWNDRRRKWEKRLRLNSKVIARLYAVSIKNVELFHLRLLLLHVPGPKSFEDLLTYNSTVHQNFSEAAYARKIPSNDNEWRDCLNEAKDFQNPYQLRQLFGFICGLNSPTNALALWEQFKHYLYEDFLLHFNEDVSCSKALLEIQAILMNHNTSCQELGLPVPTIDFQPNIVDFDPMAEQILFNEMYSSANGEQKSIIDIILKEVLYHNTESNVFCLTAYAGCGKTFVQQVIIRKLNSLQLNCISCAFSGIASTLLPAGKPLLNVFKIPIPLTETSVSGINVNSLEAQRMRDASLIIIDEISMCPILVLKLIDKLLRDIAQNQNKNKIFGGKPILMCGDFRQTLPVLPHASRTLLIENCIVSWSQYRLFHKFKLTINMRALQNENEFVDFLKTIGDGTLENFPQLGSDLIEVPQRIICTTSLIDFVYGDIVQTIHSTHILKSVILAPKN